MGEPCHHSHLSAFYLLHFSTLHSHPPQPLFFQFHRLHWPLSYSHFLHPFHIICPPPTQNQLGKEWTLQPVQRHYPPPKLPPWIGPPTRLPFPSVTSPLLSPILLSLSKCVPPPPHHTLGWQVSDMGGISCLYHLVAFLAGGVTLTTCPWIQHRI
jgi:hypothetical protein